MGNYGPVEWPCPSPDLTPLKYFYGAILKTVVYADPDINVQDFKNKIIVICTQLTEQYILSATHKKTNRWL